MSLYISELKEEIKNLKLVEDDRERLANLLEGAFLQVEKLEDRLADNNCKYKLEFDKVIELQAELKGFKEFFGEIPVETKPNKIEWYE